MLEKSCLYYQVIALFSNFVTLTVDIIYVYVIWRQVTLAGFRSGKFMTLVATNVAARELDINEVQLIIQVLFLFVNVA